MQDPKVVAQIQEIGSQLICATLRNSPADNLPGKSSHGQAFYLTDANGIKRRLFCELEITISNEDNDSKPQQVFPTQRPPLGLRPLWLIREQRLQEIKEAVERYFDAGKHIPPEWIDEAAEIQHWLEKKKALATPAPENDVEAYRKNLGI